MIKLIVAQIFYRKVHSCIYENVHNVFRISMIYSNDILADLEIMRLIHADDKMNIL
jgi:hypothetical protein